MAGIFKGGAWSVPVLAIGCVAGGGGGGDGGALDGQVATDGGFARDGGFGGFGGFGGNGADQGLDAVVGGAGGAGNAGGAGGAGNEGGAGGAGGAGNAGGEGGAGNEGGAGGAGNAGGAGGAGNEGGAGGSGGDADAGVVVDQGTDAGPVSSCAEVGAPTCFSNYDCANGLRCANIGTEAEPVACCVPGARGVGAAGAPCQGDGERICASAICIAEGARAACSDRCAEAEDCPAGLRECAPIAFSGDAALWCLPDGSSACALPAAGDILINEVLIDAVTPERENEFVEILNLAGRDLSLSGVTLRSNRGEGMADRARFLGGCLPAGARVAIFEDVADWRWQVVPRRLPVVRTLAFGFANTADFRFELLDAEGGLIDLATGSRELIREGVSANRDPDGEVGAPFVRHDTRSANPASPGAPM